MTSRQKKKVKWHPIEHIQYTHTHTQTKRDETKWKEKKSSSSSESCYLFFDRFNFIWYCSFHLCKVFFGFFLCISCTFLEYILVLFLQDSTLTNTILREFFFSLDHKWNENENDEGQRRQWRHWVRSRCRYLTMMMKTPENDDRNKKNWTNERTHARIQC